MFPDAELRSWLDALAASPAPTPTPATSFEQDARDAAPDEDRLLDTLADHITRGATPLQAAQHLFGGPVPDLAPPPVWQHFILSCAVPTPGGPGGICGEFIESEPCPAHGTGVPRG